MQRTITVKGTGTASAPTDYIRITMDLESQDYDYDFTMRMASRKIESISSALEGIGFDRKAIKTVSFNVRTDYSSEKDHNGNYKRVFKGFVCSHRLKVEFDFDTKRLAEVLHTITASQANPEISVAFTVKDPSAISSDLLKSATINAREKAEILCSASGVKLGDLLTINYNWGELDIVSHTDYDMAKACYAAEPCSIDIEPDDVSLSDTATFVWEIN